MGGKQRGRWQGDIRFAQVSSELLFTNIRYIKVPAYIHAYIPALYLITYTVLTKKKIQKIYALVCQTTNKFIRISFRSFLCIMQNKDIKQRRQVACHHKDDLWLVSIHRVTKEIQRKKKKKRHE